MCRVRGVHMNICRHTYILPSDVFLQLLSWLRHAKAYKIKRNTTYTKPCATVAQLPVLRDEQWLPSKQSSGLGWDSSVTLRLTSLHESCVQTEHLAGNPLDVARFLETVTVPAWAAGPRNQTCPKQFTWQCPLRPLERKKEKKEEKQE